MTKAKLESNTVKAALATICLGIATVLRGEQFAPDNEFMGAVMILLGALFYYLRTKTNEALA